jgi:hypothetical protein
MDDKREGRPSFKTSEVVENEVRDVIDGDRRLTVHSIQESNSALAKLSKKLS